MSFNGPVVNHNEIFKSLLEERKDFPGAIAEFGVYDGGTTRFLAGFGRTVYAFDTFEGMPQPEFNEVYDHDKPGKFKPTAPPEELFKGFCNILPVEGRFINTLGLIPTSFKFMLAYVDCDLYISHLQVLQRLPYHMVKNGVIVFDDYHNCAGAMAAINGFINMHQIPLYTVGNLTFVLWPFDEMKE